MSMQAPIGGSNHDMIAVTPSTVISPMGKIGAETPPVSTAAATPPAAVAKADHANRDTPKTSATEDIVAAAKYVGRGIKAAGEGVTDFIGGAAKGLLSICGMSLAGVGTVAGGILGTVKKEYFGPEKKLMTRKMAKLVQLHGKV